MARPLEQARVYSRTPEKRIKFAREMSERLSLEVIPVSSVEEAVEDADIVCAVTTAREPILSGEHLKPGMHINAAGANSLARRELDTRAVAICEVIAVDSIEQAHWESAELTIPAETRQLNWERVIPLAHIVAGQRQGRQSEEQITLFKSLGVGIEDVAAAAYIYEQGTAQGIGQRLPF